jgi:ectoine hydroxylase-related dioxygenase (phytanoyl-CoA dioxygenase family)
VGEPLSQSQRDAFARDGYVVVAGLYGRADGERLRRLAHGCAQRFIQVPESPREHEPDVEPWNSLAFEQAVRAMYLNDRDSFLAFHDMLQNAALLQALAAAPDTLAAVASLLGEAPGGLALSGVQLRVDVPEDPYNTYPWHQERAYYAQNVEGERALVMSLAVQDTPADHGALRVCPGSHRGGFQPHDAPSGQASGAKTLPAALAERFEARAAELAQGEALFLHMNTFHQPGRNRSQRVRYTLLCRYHQMLADPTYIATRVKLDVNPLLLKRARDRHGSLE